MGIRDIDFSRVVNAISSEFSVELVGSHGSGRTTLLEHVRLHLLERSFHVLSLHGVSSLKSRPLAAFGLAGFATTSDNRVSGIGAIVQEVLDRLPEGRSVILVDDGDQLDELSWGVLAAVQTRRSLPIVYTRLVLPASVPAAGPGGLGTTVTIELAPLRYDELATAISARAGSPVEAATLSLVYAKSAGNIGLACAIIDSGIRESYIESREGVLAATKPVWSASLEHHVQRLIEPLTNEQRDLLEILAFAGAVDIETAEMVSGAKDLEELEELSFVKVFPSADRPLVTVHPPLLVDYFRTTLRPVRRRRLLLSLTSVLEPGESIELQGIEPGSDDTTAQFVHLVHEHQRTRRIVARSEWKRAGTLASAVRYIQTLFDGSYALEALDEIFEKSRPLLSGVHGTGDETRANWFVMHAEHLAYNHWEPSEAIEELRTAAPTVGRFAGLLLARSTEIENDLIGAPDLTILPDPEVDDESEARVRAAVHRAHALVATTQGRLADSESHLCAIVQLVGDLDPIASVLTSMNLAVQGEVPAARASAEKGIGDCRAQFDPAGMRAFGAVLAFCGMIEGRYFDVEDVLDEMMTLGSPIGKPPFAPFADLSLTIMSSVVATRRGRRSIAEQRDDALRRMQIPDGAFPTLQRSWAFGQSLASTGDFVGAADLIAADGDVLWQRGAFLAAALAYNSALELDPQTERLRKYRKRIESVEGRIVSGAFSLTAAVIEEDAHSLMRLAEDFVQAQRFSLAFSALRAAAEQFANAGDAEAAESAQQRLEEVSQALEPGTYDPNRFRTVFVELTARELEIARYAASGLSNQQIADELVLSVRTVESHLHRVMRKAGVERRTQLSEFIDGTGGSTEHSKYLRPSRGV